MLSSPSISTDRDRSSYARTHNSPRFTVSSASSRRYSTKQPPSASPALSAAASSPIPTKTKDYKYVDSATQYSPSGFPPTAAAHSTTATTQTSPEPSYPLPPPPPPPPPSLPTSSLQDTTAPSLQRGASTHGAVTEPPEQPERNGPQPISHQDATEPDKAEHAEVKSPRLQSRHAIVRAVVPAESSPAKRPRSLDATLKVMPLQYETCDIKDLGVLVSDMLMELVRLNDDMPLRDGQLTRFHSRAPPAISVKDYLFRIIVHATLSPPILLSMVFYVDKLCAMYPAFTISSLTVHRFLITAATVAAKGLSDSFWTNSLYAKVGGVSLRELALLEVEFLKRLEWRIVPKPETLVDYYKGLVDRGEGYVLEKATETSPAVTTPTTLTMTTTSTTGDTCERS